MRYAIRNEKSKCAICVYVFVRVLIFPLHCVRSAWLFLTREMASCTEQWLDRTLVMVTCNASAVRIKCDICFCAMPEFPWTLFVITPYNRSHLLADHIHKDQPANNTLFVCIFRSMEHSLCNAALLHWPSKQNHTIIYLLKTDCFWTPPHVRTNIFPAFFFFFFSLLFQQFARRNFTVNWFKCVQTMQIQQMNLKRGIHKCVAQRSECACKQWIKMRCEIIFGVVQGDGLSSVTCLATLISLSCSMLCGSCCAADLDAFRRIYLHVVSVGA